MTQENSDIRIKTVRREHQAARSRSRTRPATRTPGSPTGRAASTRARPSPST
jgi:hypothetical protein